jgi:hypothetical protein
MKKENVLPPLPDYSKVISVTVSKAYGAQRLCKECGRGPVMTEPDYGSERRIVKEQHPRWGRGDTPFFPQKPCKHGLCFNCYRLLHRDGK